MVRCISCGKVELTQGCSIFIESGWYLTMPFSLLSVVMKACTFVVFVLLGRGRLGLGDENESISNFQEKFDRDLAAALSECSYPDTDRSRRHDVAVQPHTDTQHSHMSTGNKHNQTDMFNIHSSQNSQANGHNSQDNSQTDTYNRQDGPQNSYGNTGNRHNDQENTQRDMLNRHSSQNSQSDRHNRQNRQDYSHKTDINSRINSPQNSYTNTNSRSDNKENSQTDLQNRHSQANRHNIQDNSQTDAYNKQDGSHNSYTNIGNRHNDQENTQTDLLNRHSSQNSQSDRYRRQNSQEYSHKTDVDSRQNSPQHSYNNINSRHNNQEHSQTDSQNRHNSPHSSYTSTENGSDRADSPQTSSDAFRHTNHNESQTDAHNNPSNTDNRLNSNTSRVWNTDNNSTFVPTLPHMILSPKNNTNTYRFVENAHQNLHTDGQRLTNYTRENDGKKRHGYDARARLRNATLDVRSGGWSSDEGARQSGRYLEDHQRSGRVTRATYDSRSSDVPACTVLCVFTTLNVVDERGVPVETSLVKLLEDGVGDQQRRQSLVKKVTDCFKATPTEPADDNCSLAKTFAHCFGFKFDSKPSNNSRKSGI